MSKTIQRLTGVVAVKELMLPDSQYTASNGMVAPDTICGLELEIEGWRGERDFEGFNFTDDGSLRNNGIEAVSLPTKMKFVPELLKSFFSTYSITEANYSERCSTHVHMNVQNFTLEQLATLCLTYQVVERLLFTYVDPIRSSNIFCVPWFQAAGRVDLANTITSGKWRDLQTWQKYTALNLLAVAQRGTVEYRHLEGTCDVQHILGWLNLLGGMHNYAQSTPLDKLRSIILDLNTSSAYEIFTQSVFGENSRLLMRQGYNIALEHGVIDAKLMLTKPIQVAPVTVVAPSWDEAAAVARVAQRTGRIVPEIVQQTQRIRIPNWAMNLPPEQQQEILAAEIRLRQRTAQINPEITAWFGDTVLGNTPQAIPNPTEQTPF